MTAQLNFNLPTNTMSPKTARKNRNEIRNVRVAMYLINETHHALSLVEGKATRLEELLADEEIAAQFDDDDPRRVAAVARLDSYRTVIADHTSTLRKAILTVANAGSYVSPEDFAEVGAETDWELIQRVRSIDRVTTQMLAWRLIAAATCPF